MQKNAYLLLKMGADTAENERNFAQILPKIGNYPIGSSDATGQLSLGRFAAFSAVLSSALNAAFYVHPHDTLTLSWGERFRGKSEKEAKKIDGCSRERAQFSEPTTTTIRNLKKGKK